MKIMNKKAPKTLNDIVAYFALGKHGLIAATDSKDGRNNSNRDEDAIIEHLISLPQFEKCVRKASALRGMADMEITDDCITWYPVNIKTTTGGNDNAFSKVGWLYAFTNLRDDEFPGKISDGNFYHLMKTRKADLPRDYWFLSFNKSDFSKVVVRGVKQVTHYRPNSSNNLQIAWKKEWETIPNDSRTFEEVYNEVVLHGTVACWVKRDAFLDEAKADLLALIAQEEAAAAASATVATVIATVTTTVATV
jgi:hypothetical protein